MKHAKRAIGLLLIVSLLLSALPFTVLAADHMPFTDVAKTDWFYDEVRYVYEKGMMNGTGKTVFSPHATTTRGMIVTVLHRLQGKPYATSAPYYDVAEDAYYANAVAWASNTGIVEGYGSGSFGPEHAITREQLAAILFRYADLCGKDMRPRADLREYRDADKISTYAINAMQWACYEGLFEGSDGYLEPQGYATRAQVAAILSRYSQESDGVIFPWWTDLDNDEDEEDNTYTVTFYGNIEQTGIYEEQRVEPNDYAVPPGTPVYYGYVFKGWSLDASDEDWYDFNTPVTEDVELYAHWYTLEEAPEYEISGKGEGESSVYGIADLIMEGQNATVVINAVDRCIVKLRFYDESTGAEFAAAEINVSENVSMEPFTSVILKTLPDYYEAEVRLTDENGNNLCAPYICKEFTKGYEKYLSLTPDDFQADRVVYFTESKNENFGVLSDDVLCVETDGIENTLSHDGSVYTFESINAAVRGLKAGDKVTVLKNNMVYCNIKVASITVNDNAATILAEDSSIGEFYDLLNVDLGGNDGAQLQTFGFGDVVFDKSFSKEWGFPISIKLDHFSINGNASVKVTPAIKYKLCNFIELDEAEVSFVAENTLSYGISLNSNGWNDQALNLADLMSEEERLEFSELDIPTPVLGLTIPVGVSIPLESAVSGILEVVKTSVVEKGIRIQRANWLIFEYYDCSTWEKSYEEYSAKARGVAEIKCGIECSVGAELAQIFEVGAEVGAGLKLSAETEYELYNSNGENPPSIHACILCFDLGVDGYGVLGIYAEAMGKKVASWEPVSIEIPLADGYCSAENEKYSCFGGKVTFGFGECPNKKWRVLIDSFADITIFRDSEEINSGRAPLYAHLYDGSYTAVAIFADESKINHPFTVDGKEMTVTIKKEQITVFGYVTDNAGTPLINASVRIFKVGDSGKSLETKTDINGRFEFPIDKMGLSVDDIDDLSLEIKAGANTLLETKIANATKEKEGWNIGTYKFLQSIVNETAITGTVIDAVTGKPVSGLKVAVYEDIDQYPAIASAETDTSGKFTLEAPVGETYYFEVQKDDMPEYSDYISHEGNTDLGTIQIGAKYAFILRPMEGQIKLQDGTAVSGRAFEAIVCGEKAIVVEHDNAAGVIERCLNRNGREIPVMVSSTMHGPVLLGRITDGTPVWRTGLYLRPDDSALTHSEHPDLTIKNHVLTWNEGDATIQQWESINLAENVKIWVARLTASGTYVEELVPMEDFESYCDRYSLELHAGYCWALNSESNEVNDEYDDCYFVMEPVS